jgi:hypothetical protein
VLTSAQAEVAARLNAASRSPAWQAAMDEVAAHRQTPVDVANELVATLDLRGEAQRGE